LPKRLVKIEDTATDTYAMFVAEPFETGYGHTIGNACAAYCSAPSKGRPSAPCALTGSSTSSRASTASSKTSRHRAQPQAGLIKSHKRDTVRLSLSADKEGRVTAADIQADSNIASSSIPTSSFGTLDRQTPFLRRNRIKVGRGYCPATRTKLTSSHRRRRHRLALQPRASGQVRR